LAGIKGYAQVIGKKPKEARNTGFADRIVAEVLRLENLVNELLAYAGSGSFPMASVSPAELIAHTVALIRDEAEQQHVQVFSECRDNLRLFGNRDRLGQVLLNLAKNALQSMPEGGSLRILASADGNGVIITVSDSGHGIDPENLARIFEPFFTTKARGTGLGLALCKKLVEEHSGKINVASAVGEGTAVSISIPVKEQRR
jgi:two-component system sensor histidine kinase HydH